MGDTIDMDRFNAHVPVSILRSGRADHDDVLLNVRADRVVLCFFRAKLRCLENGCSHCGAADFGDI